MKEHETNVNGFETTLLLSDEDAKRYEANEVGFSRKRADDVDEKSADVDTKARKSVSNKSAS